MEAFTDLLALYVASCRSNRKEKRHDQSTTETVSTNNNACYSYELTPAEGKPVSGGLEGKGSANEADE